FSDLASILNAANVKVLDSSLNEKQTCFNQTCYFYCSTSFWVDAAPKLKRIKMCLVLVALLVSGSSDSNVLVKQKMSWSDAQAYCRGTHTDLTTIRDVAKSFWMTTLLPLAVAWIGLHRSDWAWSDGSSASYWPWATQGATEQTDCVTMDFSSGSWFQQSCSDRFSFLCSFQY
uniref:C-type lectin domain-containing protein n=1 Tax=Xiphophorus couchianus TaxID=32473 RepID=A0A3B5MVA7_9TELE